jgi:hypothetical protein
MFGCMIAGEDVILKIYSILRDSMEPFQWIQDSIEPFQWMQDIITPDTRGAIAICFMPEQKVAVLYQYGIYDTIFRVYDRGSLTLHLEINSSRLGTVDKRFDDYRAGVICFKQSDALFNGVLSMRMRSNTVNNSDDCYYSHCRFPASRIDPASWSEDTRLFWDVYNDAGDFDLQMVEDEGKKIFDLCPYQIRGMVYLRQQEQAVVYGKNRLPYMSR